MTIAAGVIRCKVVKTDYHTGIGYDFYGFVKGNGRSFAMMDYDFADFEAGDLVKNDIAVNKVVVDGLSLIVPRSEAGGRGRRLKMRLNGFVESRAGLRLDLFGFDRASPEAVQDELGLFVISWLFIVHSCWCEIGQIGLFGGWGNWVRLGSFCPA